jgi:predicted dehydrogenase
VEPVNVALIGVGSPHSRAYVRTLQLSDRVAEVILCDPDPSSIETMRAELPAKLGRSYTSVEQLLDEEGFLLAVCHLRNDLNASACLKVIGAGRHVLSEKPVGISVPEVKEVVEAAAAAGVKLGVAYINRRNEVTRAAKRFVASGQMGRVTSCETRIIVSQPRHRDPKMWLFHRQFSGGGILPWLGCHYIDLLRHTTGHEIVAVSAVLGTLSGEEIDVEDVASVSFRFDNGAIGSIQAGYQIAVSSAGYHGGRYDTYMAIRGTEGQVYWEPQAKPPKLWLESTRQDGSGPQARSLDFELTPSEAYGGQYGLQFMNEFIAACEQDTEPIATGLDALQMARIIDAAYKSNKTGRTVDLAT